MTKLLWGSLIVVATLEILEIGTLGYEQSEAWLVVKPLLFDKLSVSFIGVQMIAGVLIPFIVLGITVLMNPSPAIRNSLAFFSACLLMLQVFAMRWNVVIGGQMFSKSLRGFREGFMPEFFEKEGWLPGIVIILAPFVVLFVFGKILPLFTKMEEKQLKEDSAA